LAKSSKKQQQEEEPEIHFNRKKIKHEIIRESNKKQEEEQNQEQEETPHDEEFIKQQKKIGLMCHCGLETVLREVKKDGLNKGKMFYTCCKSYDDKCNYFMWKDESDKKRGHIQKVESNEELKSDETNEETETNEEVDEIHDEKYYKQQQKLGLMCYCKLPSVSREVKKDGANKGKIFYTCSRYYDDKCKYFVWKDEIKK
jgi:hypothetical protein